MPAGNQVANIVSPLGGLAPAGVVASTEGDRARMFVDDIWCDVLGIEEVRPDDNFFTLGGESLSAMTVVSLVSERLGVGINLEDLYESNTFSGLVELVLGAPPDA